jgi:ATP-binding cassette subfamily B (MDR/TAP) protein 1
VPTVALIPGFRIQEMTHPGVKEDSIGIREKTANNAGDDSSKIAPVAETIELPPQTEGPETKAKPTTGGLGPYFRVWTYATPLDHFIRVVGIAAAIANGAALPLMTLVFGDMVDTFNAWEAGTLPAQELMSRASKNSLWFTYLFIAILALSFLMNTCFKIIAARSTKALRRDFIRSLMRQDISYFDTCLPGSVATLISNNADLIENGMGERLGLAIEGLGQLVTSFVVAFIRQWKLTFVVATMLPLTIGVIAVSMFFMVKIDVKMLQIYTKAGGLAEESLSTMPIVTAFSAQEKLKRKYDGLLKGARELGSKKGPIIGFQYSVQWAITFVAYAIAWFYGVRLLAEGEVKTGGRVITYVVDPPAGRTLLIVSQCPNLRTYRHHVHDSDCPSNRRVC